MRQGKMATLRISKMDKNDIRKVREEVRIYVFGGELCGMKR